MSKTYSAVFKVVTPKATRVIDRFHVMRHAIMAVDQTRRRVQQQRLGHRGRAADPLYRARKLLVIKATASDAELTSRLEGLLALGDPDGEVAFAYSVKEAVARFYETADPDAAEDLLRDIIEHASRRSAPPEVRTPGAHLVELVRSDRGLAPRQGLERSDRGHEQPVETGQAGGLRLHQLRELPHPGAALRRQAQLQGARLDRGGLTWLTPLKPEEPRIHSALHAALGQAQRWSWVFENVADQATPPRDEPAEMRPPTAGQVAQLLEFVARDPALHLYLTLAATTGARRGQLLTLRWVDVDLGRGSLSIQRSLVEGPDGPLLVPTKTRRSYRVALDTASLEFLQANTERRQRWGSGGSR